MSIRANEKTRQTAMKRYFKYAVDNGNLCELYPYYGFETDKVDGTMEQFNIFTDGYSFVLTRERMDMSIESFQEKARNGETYPLTSIERMLTDRKDIYSSIKTDAHAVLEKAKELGYSYKMSECGNSGTFTYVWNYGHTYGKIGILDQAFKIIDDGKPAWIWNDGWNKPLFLETSIGICGVLPINYKPKDYHKIIGMEKIEEKR